MTTQEYIIIAIAFVTVIVIGKRLTKLFQTKGSPCDGCSGCELSNNYNKSCGEKDIKENTLG